jgi:hypothetical protein
METSQITFIDAMRARRTKLMERRDEYVLWLENWDSKKHSPQQAIDWATSVKQLDETINELAYLLARREEA